jgi:hypothetical protein
LGHFTTGGSNYKPDPVAKTSIVTDIESAHGEYPARDFTMKVSFGETGVLRSSDPAIKVIPVMRVLAVNGEACVVQPGTRAVHVGGVAGVKDAFGDLGDALTHLGQTVIGQKPADKAGRWSHVRVLGGLHADCEGIVPNDWFQPIQPETN